MHRLTHGSHTHTRKPSQTRTQTNAHTHTHILNLGMMRVSTACVCHTLLHPVSTSRMYSGFPINHVNKHTARLSEQTLSHKHTHALAYTHTQTHTVSDTNTSTQFAAVCAVVC